MAGFEKLRIWQKAHELMLKIHSAANKLPHEEKYRIKAQIERSSSSVCDNISEGHSSYYYNDKIKGMYTARKEAGETQNHIMTLESKKYMNSNLAKELKEEYEGLIKGINAYINYIRDKRKNDKSKV
ncbi:MAG: four helix bundle protein [Candidatus Omnitrophica bacterium]|nr:four helix bundle protein [Candidatus Omnitrophota bacterium]